MHLHTRIPHAKTGDAALISGYLGEAETFEQAVADFGVAYADINQGDYERLKSITT